MPAKKDSREVVVRLAAAEGRFAAAAYFFVQEAVQYTVAMIAAGEKGRARHVRGQELLEGIRQLALDKFGPMALAVLNDWGVSRTDDFGTIVFSMVNAGVLGSTPDDKPADFADGYDFAEAFLKPFAAPAGVPPRPLEKIV